jgi:Leucine-rich repeat (LRR) protein
MRLIQILTLICVIAGCATENSQSKLFHDLVDKKEATIVLRAYGLDSIPAEIGLLKDVESLTISLDSLNGWKVYPFVSAFDNRIDSPPFKFLPKELATLAKLKRLVLYDLNISQLPDNFGDLENLEYLDLSMNKLTVSKEIDKLKKLKNLKYLGLFGNRIDTVVIQHWKAEHPRLQIDYQIE